MNPVILAKRKFSIEDQRWFARLSGDHNPVHVDAIAARRLMFGAPLVHGVHLVLWALETLVQSSAVQDHRTLSLGVLTCKFPLPLKLDEEVICILVKDQNGEFALELQSNGHVLTTVSGKWLSPNRTPLTDGMATGTSVCDSPEPLPIIPECLSFEEAAESSGTLPVRADLAALCSQMPLISKAIRPAQLAQIITTTRLVGMVCPGLHSVYSAMNLAFESGTGTYSGHQLSYRVERADSRFSMIKLVVNAPGVSGSLLTFSRPAPAQQESFEELSRRIQSQEFSNQRACVIGGSRGLGEAVTKAIAAGGGEVCFTYARGHEDALRILHEIQAAHKSVRFCKLNVKQIKQDKSALLEAFGLGWVPTHLYYCASPFIFVETHHRFDFQQFVEFSSFYLDGFYQIFELLQELRPEKLLAVNWSSSALDELPANMGAYLSAKAASEAQATYLSKNWKNSTVLTPRLPRLLTDQTATLLPVAAKSTIDVVLPILRSIQASH